jgi:effector-binding domain-containing protein
MTTVPIELIELVRTPAAVVRGHVTVPEIAGFLGTAFTDVLELLERQHREPAGPPFARYRPTGDGFDIEAGFPSSAPVDPIGSVMPAELPEGLAATAVHRGSYETVDETYDAVAEWMTAHGYRPAGDAWESYLDGPGVAEPRTLVTVPCVAG